MCPNSNNTANSICIEQQNIKNIIILQIFNKKKIGNHRIIKKIQNTEFLGMLNSRYFETIKNSILYDLLKKYHYMKYDILQIKI